MNIQYTAIADHVAKKMDQIINSFAEQAETAEELRSKIEERFSFIFSKLTLTIRVEGDKETGFEVFIDGKPIK